MAKISNKRKTKVDPDGIAFIKATFNNTVITLADKFGNAISWASAGVMGFKGSKKTNKTNIITQWEKDNTLDC